MPMQFWLTTILTNSHGVMHTTANVKSSGTITICMFPTYAIAGTNPANLSTGALMNQPEGIADIRMLKLV